MSGRKKAVKKELLDKLEKKSSKKIIPPDEKPHWWFKPGNKVGLKWTDEKSEESQKQIEFATFKSQKRLKTGDKPNEYI